MMNWKRAVSKLVVIPAVVFSLAVITFESAAHAAEPLGNEWSIIIHSLCTKGIKKVGTVDLCLLEKQGEKLSWTPIAESPQSVQSGSRASAYYLAGQWQVFISEHLPVEALASKPQLELHEAFGAMGYDDRDYSLSTALKTLDMVKSRNQVLSLQAQYGSKLFQNPVLRQEGGTSVSGGGDLVTLYIKAQVLDLLMQEQPSSGEFSQEFVRFLETFPRIDFEPLAKTALTQVYLEYDYRFQLKANQQPESFTIGVPMTRWNVGDQARHQLIAEIAQKITGIFPARGGVVTRRFHPTSCAATAPTVTYPMTTDPDVASIQDFRAAAELGCVHEDHMVEYSRVAPALPHEDEPRQAGRFYFQCGFRYGGTGNLDYTVSSAVGTNQSASVGGSLDGSDTMDGTALLSGDGRIRALALRYHADNGNVDLSAGPVVAKDADHASIELRVRNQTLLFTCQKLR